MKDKKLLRVIEGAVKGDQDSYTELIRMKGKNILYIAIHLMGNRSDGEDAAQDAVILLRESIKDLRNPASFEVWMYRLVYNVCMGAKRKMKNASQNIELDPAEVQATEDRTEFLPEEFVVDEEKRHQLLAAVDQLPENYRMCVMLYYYEDMSYAEVAEVMDIKVQDVANNLSRAKKKLRYELLTTEEAASLSPAVAAAAAAIPASTPAAAVSIPAQTMQKGGALAAIPVLSRAFAQDAKESISSEQVSHLAEVAAGGITGGVAVAGTAASILSGMVFKAAIGVACVLAVAGLGAGYFSGAFSPAADKAPISHEESVPTSSTKPKNDGPALEEVLGKDEAQQFVEAVADDEDQGIWTDYAQQRNFRYQGHFLTEHYRYTLYDYKNKENGSRLMVIERMDTAGRIERAYGTDDGEGVLPQGTEIILAFEEWHG